MRPFWLVLAFLAVAAAPAQALESAAVRSDRAVATLVSDADTVAPGQTVHVGLRLRMAPGWHTYWSNPGDAGQAPGIDLTLPQGVQAGPIAWPAPRTQREGDLVTYGYSGELLLPIALSHVTGPLAVTAHATWLVCERICVPEEGDFRLTLPLGAGKPSAQAPLFQAAAAALPKPTPAVAEVTPDGRLSVTGLATDRLRSAVFLPDQPGRMDNAAPQTLTIDGDALALNLTLSQGQPAAPLSGVLLLRDAAGATSALAIAARPVAAAPVSQALPFLQALAAAFLAGVILNLMPCVFPVLAMKAMAIIRLSGAARGRVRAHALSYTVGVLSAFAVLAGLMLALRAAGGAAGWGFQFQSPVFVAATAWLMFGVGLSLSGVFTIGGRLAGAGQTLAGRGGHLGSFFTGLLAVVVATPCTAPFMGAALAAALAASAPMTFSVFLAMGLGLAAPYALLAVVPSLAAALPRPGRWMDVMKQALAFPMYAAAAWLIWVLSQEAGPGGVLAAASGLVLLGFAAWAFGLTQHVPDASGAQETPSIQARRIAQAASLAACLAALAVLSGIEALPPARSGLAQAAANPAVVGAAEPFSPARLAALRAAGRPVFVNMTAAWCITCLVNERVALAAPEVKGAFARNGVAYLLGDWTRQDPSITSFLREHARDGVPLYVFYPPGGGPPQVLPQILTQGAILDRLTPGGA